MNRERVLVPGPARAVAPPTRRLATVLIGLAVLVGCAQPATQSPAAASKSTPVEQQTAAGGAPPARASAGWEQEWEQLLAEAKKEGTVVVAGPSGTAVRDVMRDFEAQYPQIQLEYTGIIGRDFGPRVLSERQGGLKLWDVWVGGVNTVHLVLKPAGAVTDLRPAFILPEVREDRNWYGGIDFGFTDVDKKYAYAFLASTSAPVNVNRGIIPVSEFSSARQLTDPKLRGKITWQDPRLTGSGAQNLAALITAYGEEFATQLLTEQEVIYTRDLRQLTEWVVRGRYPIGIAVRENELAEFRAHGLAKDVEPMWFPELATWTAGVGGLSLMEGAPHPNAAKVYVNWLLSRRAQELWARSGTADNSRRTDVAPGESATAPHPEKLDQYIRNDEAWEPTRVGAEQLAQRLIK